MIYDETFLPINIVAQEDAKMPTQKERSASSISGVDAHNIKAMIATTAPPATARILSMSDREKHLQS